MHIPVLLRTNTRDFHLRFRVVIWSPQNVISRLRKTFHLFGACGGYVYSDMGKLFLSTDFVSSMHSLRIATSNTLVCNLTGNKKKK